MNYRTNKKGFTGRKGAFLNSIWHCDCNPRMPADKFQTKNGGKNHGRWFYTCQEPQHKRCGFFLWEDDAKVREESAVINNSRSEPGKEPHTPKKFIQQKTQAPPTPQTNDRSHAACPAIDLTKSPSTVKNDSPRLSHDDSFEWHSSDEVDLAETAAQVTMLPPFETPHKTPRTEHYTSPGKRSYLEMQSSGNTTEPLSTPKNSDDVFATPTTPNRPRGLLSPSPTPAQKHGFNHHPNAPPSDLASSALNILSPIPLPSAIEAELVDLLNKHDLRTQGIAKGRDITRLAVKSKDTKIAELQMRIAALEAERETTRTVVRHLKQDIGAKVASPKKPRGGGGFGRGGFGRGGGDR